MNGLEAFIDRNIWLLLAAELAAVAALLWACRRGDE